MRALNRLTLKQTLLLFTGTAAALCLLLGLGSFMQINEGQRASEDMLHDIGAARSLGMADMMHDALRGDVLAALLAGPGADAQRRERLLGQLSAHQKTLRDAVGSLQREMNDPKHQSALAAVLPALERYVEGSGAIARAALRSSAEAEAMRPQFEAAFAQLGARLDELGDLIEADSGRMVERQRQTFRHAKLITASVTGVAVAGLVIFGLLLVRLITQPIRDAVAVAQRVSNGDLSVEVRAEGANETAQLLRALQTMVESLRRIVGQVRGGVEGVNGASGEIVRGNLDLSSRTEEQASSLQQTAASIEQLTSTVKQNADAARQANQLAAAASAVAERGGAVVGQVVATMDGITQASKKIAEIIGVIDGIAFQTNILALNAAVEAARAGEQGRGFAVVAGEVRNLAQRSAQAAREIKGLITDSVKQVEAGSRQVTEAGRTMEDIVVQVKRVTDLIGEITSATLEQSSGISQVNQAVAQLDQMTQQNAALVEESAAAAASLKEQADKLAAAVAIFRLSQQETRQVIAQAQAASRTAHPARDAAQRSVPAPRRRPPPAADKNGDDWEEF